MRIYFNTATQTGSTANYDGWTIEAIREMKSAGMAVEIIYY